MHKDGSKALTEMLRTGIMTAPEKVGKGPPPRVPIAPTGTILEELDSDRREASKGERS